MKVLIVHNNFSNRSGPETYIRNISYIFEKNNIDYTYFSFKNDNLKNIELYDKFPETIVHLEPIHKSINKLNFVDKIKLIKNSFYNKSVHESLKDVINYYKPDLIYLLQFHLKLSSSVIDACRELKVPVVCRLSDFNFVCANNILLREGNICTKCFDSSLNQLRYNCLNNYPYTILDLLVRNFNSRRGIYNYIDHFIIPSEHNKKYLEDIDLFRNKISSIQSPYLFNQEIKDSLNINHGKFSDNTIFLNFGRQSYDKGIDIIVDNFIKLNENRVLLKLVGEQDNFIKNRKNLNNKNIEIIGKIPFTQLKEHIQASNFCIFASRWFDNLPNSLIESASMGIPPIIPNFGSFKDLIHNKMPCIFYNEGELDKAMLKAINMKQNEYTKLSRDVKMWAGNKFNAHTHFNELINIFNEVITNKVDQ